MRAKWGRIRKLKAINKTLHDEAYNQIRSSPPAAVCWLDGLWGIVAWTNTLVEDNINHTMEEALRAKANS